METTRGGGPKAEPEDTDFSLVTGDPLQRAQRLLHLMPLAGLGTPRRMLIAVLLTWLPLVLWAAWNRLFLPASPKSSGAGRHADRAQCRHGPRAARGFRSTASGLQAPEPRRRQSAARRLWRSFDRRWLRREPVDDGGLLSAPEIGPVADALSLYESVSRMRVLPASRAATLPLAAPTALPLIPLFTIQVPLQQVIAKLVGPLLGL